MNQGEREVRMVLSQTLKFTAEQIRKTEPSKSSRLHQLSKDVLAEGPIDRKLEEIEKLMGIKLPSFESVFGNTTVKQAMGSLIEDGLAAVDNE
jgi:hypothetical protein